MEKKNSKKYINMYQPIFKFLNVHFKAFKDEMNMRSTKTEVAPHESMDMSILNKESLKRMSNKTYTLLENETEITKDRIETD